MENDLKSLVWTESKKLTPQLLEIRRHLHAYPELSFCEFETSEYIKSFMQKEGIAYTDGWAKTGILAVIKGYKSGPKRLFRADMDALPIKELNEISYRSKHEGIMHACGHDVHMTCLLGMIKLMNEFKSKLAGEIYFVFQPGEEKLPGGAKMLLNEGLMSHGPFDFIIGQHVHPSMPAGKVGIRTGPYMASADEIYLTVKGRGGHAAMPNENNDTVLAACQIVNSLQQIVSRRSNPLIPSVLSFGKIVSHGGATNVIPDTVTIEGTFRTFDEVWRASAHSMIEEVCSGTALAYGVKCEVELRKGYPFLVNNEEITEKVKHQMAIFLGEEMVEELPMRMTSEDFSYYSQVMPACFYRLGTGNIDQNITAPVHNARFNVDESSLTTGTALLTFLGLTLV